MKARVNKQATEQSGDFNEQAADSEVAKLFDVICGGDEELRQWLENYIIEHPHHTTQILSRQQYIGVTRVSLDAYLAKKYFLPRSMGGHGFNPEQSNIENSVRLFREKAEGTVRHGYHNSFDETVTYLQLKNACNIAIDENLIVLVYGKPGIGKSRGLLEYAARELSIAPITVLCSQNITPHYFVQKIAEQLSLTEKETIPRLEDLIANKLIRYPRPLFVDQANYLQIKSLGSICYIWEKAHVPIVLFGTEALLESFTKSKVTEETRRQLASRVAYHYLLSELKVGEVKSLVKRVLGKEATDEVISEIFNITGGIYRHVSMILPRIIDLTAKNKDKLNNGEFTMKEIIQTAGSKLIIE